MTYIYIYILVFPIGVPYCCSLVTIPHWYSLLLLHYSLLLAHLTRKVYPKALNSIIQYTKDCDRTNTAEQASN